jgi:hypothetical protein
MIATEKLGAALHILKFGNLMIRLDGRRAIVPAHCKRDGLILEIGLNMRIPILDLELDLKGVRCTLSFSRQPFYCDVPWEVVTAIADSDGYGREWPAEPTLRALPGGCTGPTRPTGAIGDKARPSYLRLVK